MTGRLKLAVLACTMAPLVACSSGPSAPDDLAYIEELGAARGQSGDPPRRTFASKPIEELGATLGHSGDPLKGTSASKPIEELGATRMTDSYNPNPNWNFSSLHGLNVISCNLRRTYPNA